LLLLPGTDLNDWKTPRLLNELRNQDKGVIPMVRNCVERNAVAITAETEAKAKKALNDANFTPGIKATTEQLEFFNDKSFYLVVVKFD
jgi:hypothetical protein